MNEQQSPSVVIVGAGISGLMAARLLSSAGYEVTVLDKGRGVGGRLATRRIGDAVFDHGAQFVTARTELFASELAALVKAGAAATWFTGVVGADGILERDDLVRHRGVPAMTGIAKYLAKGLDVRLSARVESVRPSGATWLIQVADGAHVGPQIASQHGAHVGAHDQDAGRAAPGDVILADAVILTAPVPQTLDMLDPESIDPSDKDRLEQITYDPCIAVMAVLDTGPSIGVPGVRRPATGPVALYADNQAKGVSPVPALTVHAGPDASRELWEATDEEVVAAVLSDLALAGAQLREAQVHRWRYAQAAVTLPEQFLLLRGDGHAVVAGDGFGGASSVEGAALSGIAAAQAIIERLSD